MAVDREFYRRLLEIQAEDAKLVSNLKLTRDFHYVYAHEDNARSPGDSANVYCPICRTLVTMNLPKGERFSHNISPPYIAECPKCGHGFALQGFKLNES